MARVEVLDHGYVELVESWGSDEAIIEAARMSTQKGFLGWGPKGWRCDTTGCSWTGEEHPVNGCPVCGSQRSSIETIPGDEKLLRYLRENHHDTPFEFAGLIVEVQAPIFVFREWHRHRTQSYNEMSARYAPLPDLNYIPTVDRLELGGGHLTKQAAGVASMKDEYPHETADRFRMALEMQYAECEKVYRAFLALGVPKELARLILPAGRYSRMRASANLRNWLAFLTLRQAPTAQWEIRQYADAIAGLIAAIFPRTWELFSSGK